MNIAINGFGRIGRSVFKSLLKEISRTKKTKINIRAINDLSDIKSLVHLLKYDSAYGVFDCEIKSDKNNIIVNGKKISVFAEKDPSLLPWKELEIDIVLDCTGLFRTKEKASLHLKAGAKKVIISAPGKGEPKIKSIVLGVNENNLKKNDTVISMASCTTNCLAPLTDIIRKNFGIEKAIMTTVHAYTADQNLVDGPHKDLRRARAAAVNMVPTTTGAAIATTETIPSLKDKFDGMAVRVPIAVGSLCDVVYLTKKRVDEKNVNAVIKKESKSAALKGILAVTEEPIVSSDIAGNPASSIVDLSLTKVVGGNLLKLISWYDNEWGYSSRLADLCFYIEKKNLI
jgi:glyceraldehyde 3-phosphate dehydrogenase